MRNIGSHRGAASVVLVGVDNTTMGLVRETLTAEAVLPSSSISFGDALPAIRRTRPDVVIVGFQKSIDAAIALAQTLVQHPPAPVLVALSDATDAEAIRAAMRVGFKEYIVLPDEADRLREVVHEAAYSQNDESDRGTMVTVVGCKGGVGATLIASHLAAELAAIHKVLCVDLDHAIGDLSPMLDLSPKDDITSLSSKSDRIDERMLTGSVTVHRSKVHVLAQPGQLDVSVETSSDDIYSVLSTASKAYQYVIVDAGTALGDAQILSFTVADLILLITTPTVLAVRNAYRRIKLFESLGVEKERIRLIVNRRGMIASVPLSDIQNNLGVQVAATVADDPRTVDHAITDGKLVREYNRKSDVVRDISNMVALLTEDIDSIGENIEDDGDKGFFSKLFGG